MQVKAIFIVVALARTAMAFPTGSQFDLDPSTSDGAGGIAFTGAPRWTGHTCNVCHTDAPGQISIELQADQTALFATGYTPGTEYHLRVVLRGEHEGVQFKPAGDNCGFNVDPYSPCDENGFAVELDDLSGTPRGALRAFANGACTDKPPTDADTYILADGTAAMHNGAHFAQVQWDLCWTAPAAGTGAITAYLAAVDGNGGDGTENFPNDVIDDDVASGAVPIAEAGAPAQNGGGCAVGDGGAVVAVALIFAVRKRRRLAAMLVVASLAGCAHVRPRQRETLAKRKMTFGPDPTEDELDLHMQEAREGSSGGYGSSGGGCGCN